MNTDREKLIELLESAESAFYWNSDDRSFLEKIADHLLSHGVTFEKQGEWKKSKKEKMYYDWGMNGWFDYPEICTNCGYDATEYGCGVGNYCPNCGARMKGENNG